MPDMDHFILTKGWGNLCEAFFLPPMYFWAGRNPYERVEEIALAGGLKRYYGIREEIIVEYGCDRALIRNPVMHIREAVSLNPNIIVIFDVPLMPEDTEDEIVAKMAINRDSVERSVQFLKENGLRERFMPLGVIHADHPEYYRMEAQWLRRYVDVIGIPVAGFMIKRMKAWLYKILNIVAEEASDRIIQLMGYGSSNLRELREVIKIAKRRNLTMILEGSTITRMSRARRVLAVNENTGTIEWKHIAYVKDAPKTPKACFRYNVAALTSQIDFLSKNSPPINGEEGA